METEFNSTKLIDIRGEKLLISSQKVLYWPKMEILLLADLHLGKSNHFRANGIAIPEKSGLTNITRLTKVISEFKPKRICFLGDLFHSHYNLAYEEFSVWIKSYPEIRFDLILGNHDILDAGYYKNAGLYTNDYLQLGPFELSHEPSDTPRKHYVLSGHIHPGVRLTGRAKQSHRLPCFHFGEKQGILPAFGSLTGLHLMPVKKQDQVFAIANQEVMQVN